MQKQIFTSITLFIFLGLLLFSCKKENQEEIILTNSDLEGRWNVDSYVVTVPAFNDKENVDVTNTNFVFEVDGTCQVNNNADYTNLLNYLFNLEKWEINAENKNEVIFNRGTSLQRILTVKSITRSSMKMELIDSNIGINIVYLISFSK
ncbi:hypothetical protein [Bernardetia sp.]|uniref:hypothetical protein n=1 Tax=Bernardetia sp. TaxID=1937974 RepID=UPI0025BA507D|nr:hypothetical protein [Bernardetia sp.]